MIFNVLNGYFSTERKYVNDVSRLISMEEQGLRRKQGKRMKSWDD